MPRKRMIRKLGKFQKVNHFPGCWQLGRKDNLWYYFIFSLGEIYGQ
jgi:tubulin polyglutamylase TTLL4